MRKKVFIFIFLVICSAEKLHKSFKRCSVKDNECLKVAVQDAIPKLHNGIKELGVPPIDPLFIPEMSFGDGEKVINLKQFYKNVSLFGLANSNVTSFSLDVKDQKILMYTTVDQLIISGHYAANGKILLIPVDGSGPFNIFLDKPVGTLLIDFSTYPKKGQKFLKANTVSLIFDVSHAKYNFTNLMRKNKSIEESLGRLLNENWKEIFDELSPFYTGAYAHALLKLINRFFSKVPISDIFLDY